MKFPRLTWVTVTMLLHCSCKTNEIVVCTTCFQNRTDVIERLKLEADISEGGIVIADIGSLSKTTRAYAYKQMGSHTCYRNFFITDGHDVIDYAMDTLSLRQRATQGLVKEKNMNRVLGNMQYLLSQKCNNTW